MGEEVLVIEYSRLRRVADGRTFNGYWGGWQPYRQALKEQDMRFIPREEAESDPRFKQLIPYVIVSRLDQPGTVLSYLRTNKVGEPRLIGNRSIGIGGHINPGDEKMFEEPNPDIDMDVAVASLPRVVLGSLFRELAEELQLCDGGKFMLSPGGLVNDDITPVGQVHFGLVVLAHVTGPVVSLKDPQLSEQAWLRVPELAETEREYESWSQFCIGAMRRGILL